MRKTKSLPAPSWPEHLPKHDREAWPICASDGTDEWMSSKVALDLLKSVVKCKAKGYQPLHTWQGRGLFPRSQPEWGEGDFEHDRGYSKLEVLAAVRQLRLLVEIQKRRHVLWSKEAQRFPSLAESGPTNITLDMFEAPDQS